MADTIKNIITLKFKKRYLLIGAVLVTVLGFLMFSSYGVIKSIKLASERYDKVNELKDLKHANDSLRKKIKELYFDTTEIERIARENYGMIKPGEKVYIRKKKVEDQ